MKAVKRGSAMLHGVSSSPDVTLSRQPARHEQPLSLNTPFMAQATKPFTQMLLHQILEL